MRGALREGPSCSRPLILAKVHLFDRLSPGRSGKLRESQGTPAVSYGTGRGIGHSWMRSQEKVLLVHGKDQLTNQHDHGSF